MGQSEYSEDKFEEAREEENKFGENNENEHKEKREKNSEVEEKEYEDDDKAGFLKNEEENTSDVENEDNDDAEIRIWVKFMTGKRYSTFVRKEENIGELKRWIYSTLQIPEDQQRLIYNGDCVQSEKRLRIME